MTAALVTEPLTNWRALYVNTTADVAPKGGLTAVGGKLSRFVCGRTISFDDDCVIYVGSQQVVMLCMTTARAW